MRLFHLLHFGSPVCRCVYFAFGYPACRVRTRTFRCVSGLVEFVEFGQDEFKCGKPGWDNVGRSLEPNEKANSLHSAVWMIDFDKMDAKSNTDRLGTDPTFMLSLSWTDDNTVRVLRNDAQDPAGVTQSTVVSIDAKTGKTIRADKLSTPVAAVLAWPAKSTVFLRSLGARRQAGLR